MSLLLLLRPDTGWLETRSVDPSKVLTQILWIRSNLRISDLSMLWSPDVFHPAIYSSWCVALSPSAVCMATCVCTNPLQRTTTSVAPFGATHLLMTQNQDGSSSSGSMTPLDSMTLGSLDPGILASGYLDSRPYDSLRVSTCRLSPLLSPHTHCYYVCPALAPLGLCIQARCCEYERWNART